MGFVVLADRERTMIEREVKKIVNHDSDRSNESSAAVSQTSSIAVSKASASVVSAFLQSIGNDSHVSKDKRPSLVDEFRRYRLLASKATNSTDDHTSSILVDTRCGLPLLSSLARRFLAIPGTSVPSETARHAPRPRISGSVLLGLGRSRSRSRSRYFSVSVILGFGHSRPRISGSGIFSHRSHYEYL